MIPKNLMTIAEIQQHFGVKHAAFYAARRWNMGKFPQAKAVYNRRQLFDVDEVAAFFRDYAPHLPKAPIEAAA